MVQKTLVLEGAAPGTEQKLFLLGHCLWYADLSTGAGGSAVSMILHSRSSGVDSVISCSESRPTLYFLDWRVHFSPYSGSAIVSTEFFPRCCGIPGLVQVPHPPFSPPFIELHISRPRPCSSSASALGTAAAERHNVPKCDVRSVPCVWN